MSAVPELRLRLPGAWHPIDLASTSVATASVRRLVSHVFGASSQPVEAAERLEREISRLSQSRCAASVRALYMASELRPGVPLPATVTILEPPELRIAPAVGTGARAVSEALRQALVDACVAGATDMVELDLGEFRALRMTRIDSHSWDGRTGYGGRPDPTLDAPRRTAFGSPTASLANGPSQRHLRVDYWCTVPGSKQVIVVACWTSLGDIPGAMLRLFDSILHAAYYAPPSPIRHAAPGCPPR